MRVMTPVQTSILNHVKTFLSHRGVQFDEEAKGLKGLFTIDHPETYIVVKTDEFEIYIYEDGQCQIKKGNKSIINLEVESFDSLQDLLEKFFEKLTVLFGSYHSE